MELFKAHSVLQTMLLQLLTVSPGYFAAAFSAASSHLNLLVCLHWPLLHEHKSLAPALLSHCNMLLLKGFTCSSDANSDTR